MYTNVCKHCHKVFLSKFKSYSCEDCRTVNDKHFDDIENYLKEFPNSNALQIADALGISAYEVVNFINEGRLSVSRGKLSKLPD